MTWGLFAMAGWHVYKMCKPGSGTEREGASVSSEHARGGLVALCFHLVAFRLALSQSILIDHSYDAAMALKDCQWSFLSITVI